MENKKEDGISSDKEAEVELDEYGVPKLKFSGIKHNFKTGKEMSDFFRSLNIKGEENKEAQKPKAPEKLEYDFQTRKEITELKKKNKKLKGD